MYTYVCLWVHSEALLFSNEPWHWHVQVSVFYLPRPLGCTALFVAIRNQLSLPHVLSASLFFYLAATKVAPAQKKVANDSDNFLNGQRRWQSTQPFLGRVALAEPDGMAPPVYNQAGSSRRNSSSSLPSRVCLPSLRLFYLSVFGASRAASTLSFFKIFWHSPISESQRHRLVSERSEVDG